MKIKLRLISAVLIISMMFPILSGVIQPVFAADFPLNLYINQTTDYNANTGTLKLHWDPKSNINNANITYHIPGSSGARTITVPPEQIDTANNLATITNIQNDIIYDFEVTLTDNSGQTYGGKLYFLPKISIYAEQVDQQPVTIEGGGVETGVFPSLKISWNMPMVYDGVGNMEYVNKSGMLQLIDPTLSKLDFRFYLNIGLKDLAAIEVRGKPGETDPDRMYEAVVSGNGNEDKISSVKWDAANGKYYFYTLGAKDDDTQVPSMSEIQNNRDDDTGEAVLPTGVTQASADEWQYVLPHPEIRPGSIYVVTMVTWFYDNNNAFSDAVLLGVTNNPLVGVNNYTYTPVRFQLTKDAFDLIYVRVYRVNAGSVNMPNLYYEIQTSNTPSKVDSNWTFRTKLSDSNSGNSKYAFTQIDGINPANIVYYRVVVKSDSVNDRIQSLNLPYKMQDDTSKTPVPKNVSIIRVELEQGELAPQGEKTSNVTISWDKPNNWDEIISDPNNEIYFHFLLSVGPKDLDITPVPMLEADGKQYGQYPVKYRLVKYVSCKQVTESADRSKLIYTLDGLDLFQWVDDLGDVHDITMPAEDQGYPKYLLPNKTYYLQMYTTKAIDRGEQSDAYKMSDRSLTKSFTTLSTTGRDIPTPKILELEETKVITTPNPAYASVKIRFDGLDIDWENYTTDHQPGDAVIYDLYMSRSTELNYFSLIGTTEETTEKPHDAKFEFTSANNNTTWGYATINKFTDPDNIAKFGYSLTPNATYYFMVKVRLRLYDKDGNYTDKESLGTKLLPVTTPRGEPTTPDDSAKRPVAPIDFAIARDSNGNLMVTGESVTFEWTVKEASAAYNLIATSKRVEADTPETDNIILEDPIYKSFVTAFGNKDNNIDGNPLKLTLDPKSPQLPPNFEYDPVTKKCRYTINTWIYPNKVYYFSLRAEIPEPDGDTLASLWVSIPVTTSLIEPPTMLQVISDCELAFYWYDTLAEMTTENYKIMLKAPDDKDYTQLQKSQYAIVKDGSVYYGRIFNLKPNIQYNIRVIRVTKADATNNKEVYSVSKYTRNDYYQIEVKWQAGAMDPYSAFDIAIKTEDDNDYTVLDRNVDLEQYFDTSTQTTYPYYIEKSNSNLGTSYYTYSARINTAEVTLPDGTKEHRPLKPNTKYYIKVRAVKYDSSNTLAYTESKYVGPVNTRTEFNQGDYDDGDNNTSVTAKFLDMLDKLEQELYWDVSRKNGTINKILVRDDKVINLLQGYGNYSCTIDISKSPDYVYNDEIYMAKDVLKAMKTNNKSVILKTKNVEYTIRPDTFDTDEMEEFKKAKAVTGSNDVYLKVNNILSTGNDSDMPANVTAASKVYMLSVQAVSSRQTCTVINALIKDKLYNDETGIIKKKIGVIQNPNNTNVKGDAKKIEEYLNSLIEEVKSELSYFLEDTLNGAGYTYGTFADKFDISKFSSPLIVNMSYNSNAAVNPYVTYGSVGSWQKLTQNLKKENGYLSYQVSGTGKYGVFSAKDVTSTISDDNAAKPYIEKLASEYDLAAVFPGVDASFNPDLNVTVKEAVLLYELLSERSIDSQKDVKTKAKEYGIDKIINTTNTYRNITRQEAAAIAVKLYCQRTGTDYGKLRAAYNKKIKDDGKIADRYAAPVYYCLEMQIMNLDSNGNFNPETAINRAGIIIVLEKMLEI